MRRAQYNLLFLTLSVLGHGALVALVTLPEPKLTRERPEAITVSLMEPLPTLAPAPASETEPEATPTIANELEMVNEPMPELAETDASDEMPDEDTSKEPERDPAYRGAQLISRMAQQLPNIVSELNPIKAPEASPSYQGVGPPKLPGGPSLFDAWIGPVSPKLDQWMEPGGERHARVTLGNGQIVCIEARGLTTEELFNPWMSAAIPMSRLCGRERPSAIDLENPWLRARPKQQD